jgi:NADH-quinone oxidoreductase subunit J
VHFGGFTGGGARTSAARCSPPTCCRFEVTSVLILIAILGAIVLARKEMD